MPQQNSKNPTPRPTPPIIFHSGYVSPAEIRKNTPADIIRENPTVIKARANLCLMDICTSMTHVKILDWNDSKMRILQIITTYRADFVLLMRQTLVIGYIQIDELF